MKKYAYSFNEEGLFYGEFDHKDDAAEEVFSDDYGGGIDFAYVGEIKTIDVKSFINGAHLIEGVMMWVFDECGDVNSEDTFLALMKNRDKCDELEEIIASWFRAQGIGTLTSIVNIERVER